MNRIGSQNPFRNALPRLSFTKGSDCCCLRATDSSFKAHRRRVLTLIIKKPTVVVGVHVKHTPFRYLRQAGIVGGMVIALAAWLAAGIGELGLYRFQPSGRLRRILVWLLLLALMLSSTILLVVEPRLWAGLWILGLYRVINLLRFRLGRLHASELDRVSLRAASWIIGAQIAVSLMGWLAVRDHTTARLLLYALVFVQLTGALVMLRATFATWLHTRPHTGKPLADAELPSLSVLLPARNETESLAECLTQLVASEYPKLEIIVLDDCSTNTKTPEIIRGFAHSGVRFIHGEAPDETRWLAKNYAYEQLSREASGELLLFCGVDIRFEPQTLRLLVAQLLHRDKDMMSVMPLRAAVAQSSTSLLQPMRYFWELCLPRRVFKRPPVLSSCWLIRAEVLERDGGFEAVSRSVVPEAHFARQAVIGDRYSFIRSDHTVGLWSTKSVTEQYATAVRLRYPQLHRRLELVAMTTLLELTLLLGPVVGLLTAWISTEPVRRSILWFIIVAMLEAVYYLIAVRTRLNSPWIAWLLYPAAVVYDIVALHISLIQYEFGEVIWKGRNVCIPVMRVYDKLPNLPPRQ